MDEEDLLSMEYVNEAAKEFNAHKRAWTKMSQRTSSIEERMITLEEVVKKSLIDPAPKAAPAVTSVVAPQMTKTAVRIRIDGG